MTLRCVPWFDSLANAEAIIDAAPHCIVVDTSCTRKWAVQRLLANDNGVANSLVPDLRFTAPADPEPGSDEDGPVWDQSTAANSSNAVGSGSVLTPGSAATATSHGGRTMALTTIAVSRSDRVAACRA